MFCLFLLFSFASLIAIHSIILEELLSTDNLNGIVNEQANDIIKISNIICSRNCKMRFCAAFVPA